MASIRTNFFPYFPLPPPHQPPKVLPPPLTPPHKPPPSSPPNVKPTPPHSPPNVAPPHNLTPPTPNAPFSPKVPPPAPHTPPITPPQPHQPFNPPPPSPAAKPPPPPPTVTPPPPPPHSISPPSPPHVTPPPPPPHVIPPPPPSPGHHSTVIVIVFVSLGGLFFLAFLSVALFCFVKKRKNKTVRKTEIVSMDEHVKVQEAIVPGPHGEQNKVLLIEEDVHIQEDIKTNKKTSSDGIWHSHDPKTSQEISNSPALDAYMAAAEPPSSSRHHHHLNL